MEQPIVADRVALASELVPAMMAVGAAGRFSSSRTVSHAIPMRDGWSMLVTNKNLPEG
jgi:hypothetical protein